MSDPEDTDSREESDNDDIPEGMTLQGSIWVDDDGNIHRVEGDTGLFDGETIRQMLEDWSIGQNVRKATGARAVFIDEKGNMLPVGEIDEEKSEESSEEE